MVDATFKCPECEYEQTKADLKKHFEMVHQAKETDYTRNPYISFPHEQIPRLIEGEIEGSLPEFREQCLEPALVQFYQESRLLPSTFEAQKSYFASVKTCIEAAHPAICRVDPNSDWQLATKSTAFDIIIRLSKSFLNSEKAKQYDEIYPDDTSRVRIASNFLQRILPQTGELDPRQAVYYLRSYRPQVPKERLPPGAKPSESLVQLKHVGIALKVDRFMFDISAYNDLGFWRLAILQAYTQLHPYVSMLIVIVKAWAERRRISGKMYGRLSPFCLSLLVIHFLQNYPQRRPLLPLLQKNIQSKFKRAATPEELRNIADFKGSLAKVFYEMFKYYAEFEWKTLGLSIREAGFIPNSDPGYPVLIENPLPPYDNLADHFQDKQSTMKMKNEFRRVLSYLNFDASTLKEPRNFESCLLQVIMDPDAY